MRQEHILVVEDEESMRRLIFMILSNANYGVTAVGTAEEALDIVSLYAQTGRTVDLLLTDYNLPGLSGLNLIDELKRRGKDLPTFVMSGSPDEGLRSSVIDRHCAGYLKKPFSISHLIGEIGRCLGNLARTRKDAELALEWAEARTAN